MSYKIDWDSTALDIYFEETEFILLKWNSNEVQKFKVLVGENLERLSKNPKIGICNSTLKVCCLVISKQTSLYYSFFIKTKVITLHVFWNNLKNPEELAKLL